ncbi:hypothetical protein J7F01_21365 [Streptomyces sp. ISL-22]|uniref:Uncharacterized protein n=1 Tax=Streptomyces curacoi TaxID=146536 RepID=A0A117PM98_9ACTN|nr:MULTISPECIES: hypothetical protein [Streptomyces]KUM82253.1 hypothetical protein AQI70_00095 [Streptomyces curacoi]MBT2418404.1 hypothetical protein [Streptomyces sp. ISL-24]MBT2434667.1 hypothetical protein [Streptomyces sp. ISL-22]
MSARMHTSPHPASTGRSGVRLPWWALALPTLAFITLLTLILNPSEAHAATAEPAITQLFERIQQLIMR